MFRRTVLYFCPVSRQQKITSSLGLLALDVAVDSNSGASEQFNCQKLSFKLLLDETTLEVVCRFIFFVPVGPSCVK